MSTHSRTRDDGDDADRSARARSSSCSRCPFAIRRHCRTSCVSCSAARGPRATHAPGGELRVGSIRRSARGRPECPAATHADPLHRRRQAGRRTGRRRALHPEWDVFNDRYRPDWCRVIDFPLTAAADVVAAGVPRDDVLRRRLSRVGLGPKVLRRRPDGDDLDIEALIELAIDLRSGYSPPEHVYLREPQARPQPRRTHPARCSGSATDTDSDGLAVHDHQRRAAATLAADTRGAR